MGFPGRWRRRKPRHGRGDQWQRRGWFGHRTLPPYPHRGDHRRQRRDQRKEQGSRAARFPAGVPERRGYPPLDQPATSRGAGRGVVILITGIRRRTRTPQPCQEPSHTLRSIGVGSGKAGNQGHGATLGRSVPRSDDRAGQLWTAGRLGTTRRSSHRTTKRCRETMRRCRADQISRSALCLQTAGQDDDTEHSGPGMRADRRPNLGDQALRQHR